MVDILMATYNGEQYIEAQILSIIAQVYKDWRLLIHDDGSKDSTLAIVRKWSQIDDRIKIIDDGIRCGGAAQNFMHLLKYSDSEFIMFCDQDDIWFDNKVELMYSEIEQMDSSKPRLIYTNSYVWYPEHGIKGVATLTYAENFQQLLFLNSGVQGCVAIFDSSVRELMKHYQGELSMHDHLLNLLGASLANCRVLDLPLMLYRNHNKNVTGRTKTNIVDYETLRGLRNNPVICSRHFETVEIFRKVYSEKLNNNQKKVIDAYLSMPDRSLFMRLILIVRYRFQLYGSIFLLILKVCFKRYKA